MTILIETVQVLTKMNMKHLTTDTRFVVRKLTIALKVKAKLRVG